ncbi:CBS domain-containing protein CBSX6 [Raphanus sativus]|uniref:CBS domain-containing protein CBSX6 n=1 Tax=Raphanus sativus TaxID=3726 RepID=A0A6J0KEM9_RAPSA|nr:CBS domain-containing protein CBSX6 [Raphanus sativus]KAJ4871525.1 CBS domain-containing protein CBSX6 [Raphanus sativus]
MASVFLYHVVGDLTVGKPEMVEFYDTETVESAIRAIGESTECGIPVWRKRSVLPPHPHPHPHGGVENSEMRQQRFVGILSSLDIVAFLAKSECLEEDKAMKIPVSQVVSPNNSLLKQVDPATRLIDALEMMKQGVRRLLVPKSVVWRGMSKRFSILYNGKWLKNSENSGSSSGLSADSNRPATSKASSRDKFCCLSREDVIRFLIGVLGALAPLPLTSISSLGIINVDYNFIEASLPAIEATKRPPCDPSAIAVLEQTEDDKQFKIIGEISASKLWKCDYLAAAWALANLYAGQFVMGVEDNMSSRSFSDFLQTSFVGGGGGDQNGTATTKAKKFSSRSIGFNPTSPTRLSIGRSMYRGRSAPLTCKTSSSLAAVMAQMLSHRATHVWVTEADSDDDILVGVVGYGEILAAVTKQPSAFVPSNRSYEGFGNENQS